MPAAAVIPAPVAYTNIAAVKKLVVECRVDSVVGLVLIFGRRGWLPSRCLHRCLLP